MTDAWPLTLALGGKWYGAYGTAPCPVCQIERRPDQTALTLTDGVTALLAHCKRLNCNFRDIAAAAGLTSGDYAPLDAAEIAQREASRRARTAQRRRHARLRAPDGRR